MKIIATTHRVRRWTRSDCTGFQVLERVTRVLGMPIWCREIDREDVPSWAFIQRACLGETDWESRLFKDYAHLLA
ncbi:MULTISPECIES: hypothetical protein [Gammaproteobacteria]|uniref:Uncharacterized protein n=2 Tax=Pseudomonadota TaxID=1224 RepID=A0A368TQ61_9GAMM|nr:MULTISPECIES: hypothetical protein [Gammaproteobacteria]MBQ5557933.1 hypothetical protein [Aeriscardovia sp.]MBQ9002989.1 hypothetical protein [Eggerthellaceae bacterium]MBR2407119.1 hypothetical protein [Clostridia bacterium]MBG9993424.1 hypothetical protein [Pseudoalteromonas sp. NZS37]MBH0013681.1 hypothetical protein [Pseudoalteromonas sp. NZS100_1]